MTDSADRIEINGEPARVEDLRLLAQTNYGHFSAMQVVDGCVRGLDLHLERIERATRELFGTMIDRERVRACLRHAVADSVEPLAVRVNVFARALNRNRPVEPVDADILVMSARPGRIKLDRPVPIAHPRHYSVKTTPAFSEIKAELTEQVRVEVRAAQSDLAA